MGYSEEVRAASESAMMHVYEVRPRKDHRSVDLISDVLPFGRRRFALRLFEIVLVLVRFDHVASRIVNANHSLM